MTEWLQLSSLVSSSVIKHDNSMYVFGGLDSVGTNQLYRLHLPADVCELYRNVGCQVLGCSAAVFTHRSGENETVCYSAESQAPKR